MRVLVVGRQGQIAKCLADVGPASSSDVVAVGRPELDLCEPDTIMRALDQRSPDVVVNAAAYTAVDKAESEPGNAFAINGEGAGAVAAACSHHSIPLIHISTDYVFDGEKQTPYDESHAVRPLNVYGRSKLQGEKLVSAAAPMHVILRTAWTFSPYGTNFVRTMRRLAEEKGRIDVVDDQFGCPTYAPHLAVVILAIAKRMSLDRDRFSWGTYHAAGNGETTWYGLAREIFSQSRTAGGLAADVRPIKSADFPAAARRPRNSRLDCRKLQNSFGLVLPDWRIGIRDCIAALNSLGPNEGR